MKTILLWVHILFPGSVCLGQNLVDNWSFEDTVACPYQLTQIDFSTGWTSYYQTPDYFNSCAVPGIPNVSVPNNQWGHQDPKTGVAYSAIITFSLLSSNSREILGCQLNSSMIIGQQYFVSFYVSPTKGANNYPGVACNKLGAKFSTVSYTSSNPISINNFAHVFSDSIIKDTINWIPISGSFIADSAYQFLAIGNFFEDSLISYFQLTPNSFTSAYYIDDVRVSSDSIFVNSINESQAIDPLTIFPNPANDWIEIYGENIESLEIYDMSGKLVYKNHEQPSKNEVVISTIDFADGLYLLRYRQGEQSGSSKFVIEN